MSGKHLLVLLSLVAAGEALRLVPTSKPQVQSLGTSRQSPIEPAVSHPSVADAHGATAVCAALVAFTLVEPAAAADVSWVGPTRFVLQPLLTLGTLAFLFRVVLSWFPKYNLNEMPFSLIAAPTEPFLKPTRLFLPPVAGVDISPIVWVAILSFISEIVTGPQGVLSIMERNGGL